MALPCFREAQPFTAMVKIIQAMRKLTNPIVTVNANMTFRSLYSIDNTVSWLCIERQLYFRIIAQESYTSHHNYTPGHKTESCNKLGWWSWRQQRGWRGQIEDDIGQNPGKGCTHQKSAPLLMHHGWSHRLLMVRAHHHSQKENYQGWKRVHGDPVAFWRFPTDIFTFAMLVRAVASVIA